MLVVMWLCIYVNDQRLMLFCYFVLSYLLDFTYSFIILVILSSEIIQNRTAPLF